MTAVCSACGHTWHGYRRKMCEESLARSVEGVPILCGCDKRLAPMSGYIRRDPRTYEPTVGDGMAWVSDDGGRAAAGFRGTTGDCVVRSIAIATGIPYCEVYDAIAADMRAHPRMTRGKASPRDGVRREFYEAFLRARGWRFVPTMGFGTGTRVHLRADELPSGRIIVRLSKHMAAVIDGVVHDTHDPSRGGTRCVYGYYTKEAA